MRALVTLLAIFIFPVALSADWRNIDGIYAVTSRGYLDPSANEQKDSHFRIQLKGKSAKDLYAAMKVKPVIDE